MEAAAVAALLAEDPFLGLPTADGPSLFAGDTPVVDDGLDSQPEVDDDDGEEGEEDESVAAAPVVAPEAVEKAGATDDSHLPPWMRSAHATIIHPSTPAVSSLGLDSGLLKALKRMGVRKAFPVQASVVPIVLAAHAARCAGDVCVCAPTGSGKTLAYALPVVQSLLTRQVGRLRALVLLPTRGLAAQVRDVFTALCEGTPLKVGLAAGHEGVSFERERASIVRAPRREASFFPGDDARFQTTPSPSLVGPSGHVAMATSAVDILVATPGRLVEHLQAASAGFTLSHLRWLVVDEADRLLSHGYQDWLAKVLDAAHHDAPIVGGPTAADGAAAAVATSLRVVGGAWTRRPKLGTAASLARGAPLGVASDPPLLKLLFSATLTRSAAKLAPLKLTRPRYFCVAGARYATPATLREWMLTCKEASEKPQLLALVLCELLGIEAGSGALAEGGGASARAAGEEQGGDEDGEEEEGGGEEEGEEEEDDDDDEKEKTVTVEADAADDDDTADALLENDEDGADDDDDDDDALGGARSAKRRRTDAPQRSRGTTSKEKARERAKVIVFASTLESTHRLTRLLQLLLRIDVCEFSSSVGAKERSATLERFKRDPSLQGAPLRVLVASDAMARGMDVEGVTAVINYDPPANIKAYVHRVGRTARAGKSGTSYTLLRDAEVHHFKTTMAKASKPWRPLTLPDHAQRLALIADEYQSALDRLGVALSAERSGALAANAPRAILERVLDEAPGETGADDCDQP